MRREDPSQRVAYKKKKKKKLESSSNNSDGTFSQLFHDEQKNINVRRVSSIAQIICK
ncbi:hypothetical protein PUN28_000667 [Cardiocondyla obscurior]|uniref:Uncharacterized protein n=1 Tax=Cardiocondyla obscurior TaxID=286306 RepID=A0AAW2H0J2_9HYME